jgi:hypothetical protein
VSRCGQTVRRLNSPFNLCSWPTLISPTHSTTEHSFALLATDDRLVLLLILSRPSIIVAVAPSQHSISVSRFCSGPLSLQPHPIFHHFSPVPHVLITVSEHFSSAVPHPQHLYPTGVWALHNPNTDAEPSALIAGDCSRITECWNSVLSRPNTVLRRIVGLASVFCMPF